MALHSGAAPALSFNVPALLAHFPPTRYSMAYGSGVFAQRGALDAAPMLDFVFAVDCPAAWHADNLRRNRSHYTALAAAAGAGLIARLQESTFGARVWYNALVPVPAAAVEAAPSAAAAVSSAAGAPGAAGVAPPAAAAAAAAASGFAASGAGAAAAADLQTAL
jgi:hypothetical protein